MSYTSNIVKVIERQRNGEEIIEANKTMLRQTVKVIGEDDNKMIIGFRDFFVEIFFSSMHPLMVIRFVKFLEVDVDFEGFIVANNMNKDCIYGSHSFDREKRRYYFQATQWLDGVLSSKLLYDMFKRYDAEATKFLEKING